MGCAAHPICPVCEMEIDPKASIAAKLVREYQGTTYYFCSDGCRSDFVRVPERFL